MDSWTCKKNAEPGDLYLFWFGDPLGEISGFGIHNGVVRCEENFGADWTNARQLWFGSFEPLIALRRPVTRQQILSDRALAHWWEKNRIGVGRRPY